MVLNNGKQKKSFDNYLGFVLYDCISPGLIELAILSSKNTTCLQSYFVSKPTLNLDLYNLGLCLGADAYLCNYE